MKNSALIKWLDKQHDQESIMIEMGLGEDGECEINKMHIEVLKRKVEDSRPKWISVKSHLPTERRIAYMPSDDKSLEYRFIPEGLFKQAASEATHWQPLPPPPLNYDQ